MAVTMFIANVFFSLCQCAGKYYTPKTFIKECANLIYTCINLTGLCLRNHIFKKA